jgi:hypothetical protein
LKIKKDDIIKKRKCLGGKMNQQAPMQQQPGTPMEPPKQGVATWLWVTLVIVIIAAIAVWYFYLR